MHSGRYDIGAGVLGVHEGAQEVVAAPDHRGNGVDGITVGICPGLGARPVHLHDLLIVHGSHA